MRDEVIEEVERIREELARRYDFDIDRIFQAAKERSAKREETEPCQPTSTRETEGAV